VQQTAAGVPGASDQLHHEDLAVGEPYVFGRKEVTAEEIIAYARAYDPQPMHTDPEAAKASLFGDLCASGWHTAAHFIRCIIASRGQGNAQALAKGGPSGGRVPVYGPSPGCRDLKWLKPVFVGDTITYRSRLIERADLKSRPNRGLLASAVQGRNQKGEIVFAVTSLILADRRRPANGE